MVVSKSSLPLFWAMVVASVVLAAAPLWLVDVLPVLDYPAHFTRAALLAGGGLDPVVSRFWELDLRPRPNLALDLIVPALAPLFGVTVAMKLFVSSILALWIVGPVLIHRAVWGRFGWESLAAGVFALNACFFVGFYNFLFGVGLAFLVLAAWLAPTRRPLVVALALVPLTLAVLISHLMAFAVLALLLAAIEGGRLVETAGQGWRSSLARLAVALLPGVVATLAMRESGGDPTVAFNVPANLVAVFLYASRLGGMIDPVPVIALLAVVALAWRAKALAVASVLRLPLVAVALVMLVSPSEIFSGAMVHWRMAPILGALFVSAWRLEAPPRSVRAILAGLVVFAVAATGVQTLRWRAEAATIDAARRALAAETAVGARVLPAITPGASLGFVHVAELAILDRRAFVPTFFTTPGQSPIRLRPDWQRIGVSSAREGEMLRTGELPDLARDDPALSPERHRVRRPYLAWPCHFDELLILGPDAAALSIAPWATRRASGEGWAVHRIERPSVGCPAPTSAEITAAPGKNP